MISEYAIHHRTMFLVFWGQTSQSWIWGFTLNECVKERRPLSILRAKIDKKIADFAPTQSVWPQISGRSIKLWAPVILLCIIHVDPASSHCNGTFYIVHHISRRYITARTACGEYSGTVLLLPCNPLSLTVAGIVPLDNLCLTDINSPRSRCNA